MTAQQLVSCLLDLACPAYAGSLLDEASVHLPRRGTRWIASFRDETGRQVWRSTGLTDRAAALALAKRWEEEGREKRISGGFSPRKPTMRVRRDSAERSVGLLSQREVAALLRISERAVRDIERTAFDKLRRHPVLRQLWREWEGGELHEADLWVNAPLSQAEMAALLGLARTNFERRVLRKLLWLCRPTAPLLPSATASGLSREFTRR